MAAKKAPAAAKSAAKTPKSAAPAKAAAQSTVTLRHLAAELAENHEMPFVIHRVLIGADKDDAASYGRRAITGVALHDIRDIRDPAHTVRFGRGAGVERMQLVITSRYVTRCCDSLAPCPDYEHVVPGGTRPSVIVVSVDGIKERRSKSGRRELPAQGTITRIDRVAPTVLLNRCDQLAATR